MPPNVVDLPNYDPESVYNAAPKSSQTPRPAVEASKDNYKLNIFQSSLNLLAHTLIGVDVGVILVFVFRNGLPISVTSQHIVLCVLGYQLLMAQAFLSLSPHNGWSSRMRLVDKRRAHWVLQILGSGLALGGSFIMILEKTFHWDTFHGKFALVAMVFTTVSLVNGLTSLYAYELRKYFIPQNLSKITHILFGIVAFAAASISLCYGFEKSSFRNWAGLPFTITMIVIVAAFTTIIIINPFIIFFNKSTQVIKKQ